ncbi:MAG: hypothetical protein LBT00_08185 [Spirochaetaceae bacterium]|nr:hypothetical protein [Spirochaetaceae bacterium]
MRGRSPKQSRGEGPHTGLLRFARNDGGGLALTARSATAIFHYPFIIFHSRSAGTCPAFADAPRPPWRG